MKDNKSALRQYPLTESDIAEHMVILEKTKDLKYPKHQFDVKMTLRYIVMEFETFINGVRFYRKRTHSSQENRPVPELEQEFLNSCIEEADWLNNN
jgi:hypothetical protein